VERDSPKMPQIRADISWLWGDLRLHCPRENRRDIEIVGIVEPNRKLARRYADHHGYLMDLVYDSLEEMLDPARPEAITVFTTILDHRRVEEVAAECGVHMTVEKPLAVSLEDALAMADAARKGGMCRPSAASATGWSSV
jgi:predicted dehydrogenase